MSKYFETTSLTFACPISQLNKNKNDYTLNGKVFCENMKP